MSHSRESTPSASTSFDLAILQRPPRLTLVRARTQHTSSGLTNIQRRYPRDDLLHLRIFQHDTLPCV